MIFSPEMAKLVLAGRKHQTRRVIKSGEKTCRYRRGKVYAIQPGRGKPAIGRITVLDVREETLGAISLPDVKREGFRTTKDFEDYWREFHGAHDPHTRVWVIIFVKGDVRDQPRLLRASSPKAPICTGTLKLQDGRRVPCKSALPDRDYMTDKPIERCPRCGTKRPPVTVEDHGYTSRKSSAMKGEGEAVPARTQERITARAAVDKANGYIVQRERLRAAVCDARVAVTALGPFVEGAERAVENLKGIERQLRSLDRKMRIGSNAY